MRRRDFLGAGAWATAAGWVRPASAQAAVAYEPPLWPGAPEFGAPFNGVDDDAPGINLALEKAGMVVSRRTGGEVVLPRRPDVRIGSPLRVKASNVTCYGVDGYSVGGGSAEPYAGGTLISLLPGFQGDWAIDASMPGTPTAALAALSLRNVAVDGYWLPKDRIVGGVRWQAQRSKMTDVTLTRMTGTYLYMEAVDHVTTYPKGCYDDHFTRVIVRGPKGEGYGGHGIHTSPGASDSFFNQCVVGSIPSGRYGVFQEGVGNQFNGGLVELCRDWGIYNADSRGNLYGGLLRVVETFGGMYLTTPGTGVSGGDWHVGDVVFRTSSWGADGVRDAIMVDPKGIMRGGLISGPNFSVVKRNTNPDRPRHLINIANPKAVGVTIGSYAMGYLEPALSTYTAADPVNDLGTDTRRLDQAAA